MLEFDLNGDFFLLEKIFLGERLSIEHVLNE